MVISLSMLRRVRPRRLLPVQGGGAADYYLGAEPPGRWLGSGACRARTGRLDAAGAHALRSLLTGKAPDGQQLVSAVVRADPRGRLPAVRCRTSPLTSCVTPTAPALINGGMSLQALMSLLGHVTAEMTLRYASLASPTVK